MLLALWNGELDIERFFPEEFTLSLRLWRWHVMETDVCSFLAIFGGHCAFNAKDRSRLVQLVPLLTCNHDISRHKLSFAINGVENKVELKLGRASIYMPPWNVETWTICPQQHASLVVSWKHTSTKYSIPVSLSKHDIAIGKKPKAQRGLGKSGSQFILKETGIFLPVGTGQLFVSVFITKVSFT